VRKRFSLTERVKLDFRVEYFNVFNNPMFGSPGSDSEPESRVGFPGFGMVEPGNTTTYPCTAKTLFTQSAARARDSSPQTSIPEETR
jgi:hypothetical protein